LFISSGKSNPLRNGLLNTINTLFIKEVEKINLWNQKISGNMNIYTKILIASDGIIVPTEW
jgi:hypothetical protein